MEPEWLGPPSTAPRRARTHLQARGTFLGCTGPSRALDRQSGVPPRPAYRGTPHHPEALMLVLPPLPSRWGNWSSSPPLSFVTDKVPDKLRKARREFFIPAADSGEASLHASEFQIRLCNMLTQRAIARHGRHTKDSGVFRSSRDLHVSARQLACRGLRRPSSGIRMNPDTWRIVASIVAWRRPLKRPRAGHPQHGGRTAGRLHASR
jgi:hypothetical protein